MKKLALSLVVLLGSALTIAPGCGDDSDTESSGGTSAGAARVAPPAKVVLRTAARLVTQAPATRAPAVSRAVERQAPVASQLAVHQQVEQAAGPTTVTPRGVLMPRP
jgi:hypothetical protein